MRATAATASMTLRPANFPAVFWRPRPAGISARPAAIATVAAVAAALLLAGCAAPPPSPSPSETVTTTDAAGGYYGGDRPPARLPVDPATVADAVPRAEPLSALGNRPYTALGKRYQPLPSAAGYVARGTASWYGQKFHGRRTSSGEIYDMFAMTAAHPVLPLPSFVRVTRLDNGQSVVVRVNDRGPFLHGRIIDLSYIAAHKLGIAARGTGRVEVRALTPAAGGAVSGGGAISGGAAVAAADAAAPARKFLLQVGAYSDSANARRMRERLESAGYPVAVRAGAAGARPLYRVRVGPFPNPAAARATRQALETLLQSPVALVSE